MTALIGALLGWSGYAPNESPDASVRDGLLFIFVGVPAAASLVSALVLRGLRVDDAGPVAARNRSRARPIGRTER